MQNGATDMAATTYEPTQAASDLANALFEVFRTGNWASLREITTPDFAMWFSFDNQDLNIDQAVAIFSGLPDELTSVTYENVRRHFFPGGFMQRHLLRDTRRDGQVLVSPCCL